MGIFFKATVVTCCCLAVVGIINAALVVQHETAHQQIFRQFGVNSTIHYGFLWQSGAAWPENEYPSSTDARLGIALHSMNEVFGYQISVILFPMVIMLFLIFLCLPHREDKIKVVKQRRKKRRRSWK